MLWRDFAVGIHEIDVGIVVGRDDLERSPPRRRRQAQYFCQKCRRCSAVMGIHDGVIEINGHATSFGIGDKHGAQHGRNMQSKLLALVKASPPTKEGEA